MKDARPEKLDVLTFTTHRVVEKACQNLGISDGLTIWCIIQYGVRNRTFHRECLKAESKLQTLNSITPI